MHRRSSARALIASALCLFFARTSIAQEHKAFPSTIDLAISAGPGSGYDTYARLAARHLGDYLPGRPKIVPRNMPGADGLRGAEWLAASAPRDGSAIAMLENSSPFEPLLEGKAKGGRDPLAFGWIGSLNSLANIVLVWGGSSVRNVSQLFSRPIIVGATSGRSDSIVMPKLLNEMIGTKFKIVTGYSSSNEIVLAMERGEVEGALGISSDSLAGPFGALVRSGKLRILMQIDLHPSPEPFLQDVPSVLDYVKRPADRAVLDLLLAKLDFGRPFAAPPNTPPAILADLRRAFARMVRDPSFLHDAQTMNIPIQFTPGEDVAQAIAAVYAKPGDVVARAARIVNGGASTP